MLCVNPPGRLAISEDCTEPSLRLGPSDDEIHERLAAEEPLPVIMALPLGHDQRDRAGLTGRLVARDQLARILLERHDFIVVAVNQKYGHCVACKDMHTIDRI